MDFQVQGYQALETEERTHKKLVFVLMTNKNNRLSKQDIWKVKPSVTVISQKLRTRKIN
jgi:hypothetical protein